MDEHYPDGRLFVAFNGSGDAPPSTGMVLRRLLRTLGIDPADICEDVEECAALYRSNLAGRRMLIVIDDAVSSAQVRALLPGTTGCAVIVTSRSCLLDLDGARWLVLRELDEEQACILIGRIIGAARAAAEPEAVTELARLCGHLPLAIRIVGARLAVRPSWSVRDVVRSLTEEPGRLDTLSDDCGQRLSHALGRGSLTAEEAGALRLLAASSIRDLSLDAVSALLGTGIPESRRIAEHLVDLHQLYSRCQDRYYYPDLHHLYAREQVGQTPSVEWQRSAVRRLSERYLDTIRDALLALHIPEPSARPQRFPDAATALAWLEAEHANIITLIDENSRPPITEPETACALLCHLQSCEYRRADLLRSGAAPIVAQGSNSERH